MPRVRVGAALVAAVALLFIGCTPRPAPAVPFSEFTVSESGGIDGRHRPLLVRPDGVALLMSNDPASGSIQADDLARLRVLLTSVEFRQEAAADGRRDERQRCADDIVWTVTMGALSVEEGDCSGDDGPTPATDEIIRILSDEVRGEFILGVPAGEPDLVPATLDRQASQYYPRATLRSTAAGDVTLRSDTGVEQTRRLVPEDRDTLRLLLDRQASRPAHECRHPGPYRLLIGGATAATVTSCVGEPTPPELRATIAVLENLFER